jgi:hypothetical protein
MATLEWGDTFAHYQKNNATLFSASVLAKKWTIQQSADDASYWVVDAAYALPGSNGGGLRVGAYSNGRNLVKTLPLGSQATRCFSVWFNPGSGNTQTGTPIIAFFDVGSEQLSVRLDGSAHIIVSRNGNTLATSTNTVSSNTWYHLQFKATIHNTTGAYEVKVNNTSTNWIPAATNQNTRGTGTNNTANQVAIGSGSSWTFTQVAIADDFTGQVQGVFLRGAGPGNVNQWAANSGDNRGAVADRVPDDDASFISSTTSGNVDLYVMEKLPSAGTPTILGVQHVIYAKQDAGVQRTLRPKTRAAGTTRSGTSVNTGASYTYITEAVSVDPETGVAWTRTSLDATEFGVENV